MKISVLVTYYNQKKYVARSLESVLRQQTRHDVEILVGDDGSSDGTAESVREYAAAHPGKIRLFVMPREAGVRHEPRVRFVENQLHLLGRASGDYVCFLDGDDFYIDALFLDSGAAALAAHPECPGCMFGYAKFWENEPPRAILLGEAEGYVDWTGYLPGRYIPCGTILFRRTVFDEKLQMLSAKKVFGDNLTTFCSLKHGALYHIPRPVYGYWQNPDGIWGSSNEAEQHLANALDFNPARKLTPPELIKYMAKRYHGPLAFLFANRERLAQILGEKVLHKYRIAAARMGSPFIKMLLHWDVATERQKYLALRYYKIFLRTLKVKPL